MDCGPEPSTPTELHESKEAPRCMVAALLLCGAATPLRTRGWHPRHARGLLSKCLYCVEGPPVSTIGFFFLPERTKGSEDWIARDQQIGPLSACRPLMITLGSDSEYERQSSKKRKSDDLLHSSRLLWSTTPELPQPWWPSLPHQTPEVGTIAAGVHTLSPARLHVVLRNVNQHSLPGPVYQAQWTLLGGIHDASATTIPRFQVQRVSIWRLLNFTFDHTPHFCLLCCVQTTRLTRPSYAVLSVKQSAPMPKEEENGAG